MIVLHASCSVFYVFCPLLLSCDTTMHDYFCYIFLMPLLSSLSFLLGCEIVRSGLLVLDLLPRSGLVEL